MRDTTDKAVAGMEAGGGVERYGLLASALSGRALEVTAGASGTPAWTDGKVVFIDAGASRGDQLEAVAVQASLLAAGSLDPEVVRTLARSASTTRRYLTVEGHRALAANRELLPLRARALVDGDMAARADSPAASLALARSREAILDPPPAFGRIRVKALLATRGRAEGSPTATERAPHERVEQALIELAEDAEDDGRAGDLFSSRVGGGGAIGRFLQRMLTTLARVRRLEGGGPPGADLPTHRTRAGTPATGSATFSPATASVTEEAVVQTAGARYPEWDVHRRRYRHDWCTVQEVEPLPKAGAALVAPDPYRLRRPLTNLGVGLLRCHRQAQGHDLDIDAAIEARVEVLAGSAPDEGVYVDSLRRRRDLAVLLLLDVSGSAAEPGTSGKTVHEQQCAAAAALTVTLHDLGDRVALYAYRSQGRAAVHLLPVKRFDDGLDTLVIRRLHGLVPGAYSRLGAAIRHGAAVLEEQGGTSQRLLVVLSDGLAYDHGYERAYGAADARHALAEARRRGTACLCMTIGAGTDTETLRRVFGSAAHAVIPEPTELHRVIRPLFRSALRAAGVRGRAR